MKLIERKPRMSTAAKKKREVARRKNRVNAKCKSEPKVLSDKFKAAIPSANKISQLDYEDFMELKKNISKHLSKIRAHAKRCNSDFEVPSKYY
ncbi:unnamed protein product [Ectocarpus sp. 12 AP-2014]